MVMTERFTLLQGYGITAIRDISTHTCMHTCIHTCTCTHAHMCVQTHTYPHTCTDTCFYFNYQSRTGKGVEREIKQLTFTKISTASCIMKSPSSLWTLLQFQSLTLRDEERKKPQSEEPGINIFLSNLKKSNRISRLIPSICMKCRGFLKNSFPKNFYKADIYAELENTS